MISAAWAVVLAAVAFAIHVVVWRTARPVKTASALARIFSLTLAAGLAVIAFVAPEAVRPARWTGYAEIVLAYLGLMAAYINTYPAVEAESPTLNLLRALAAAGKPGLSIPEAYQRLGAETLVSARIRDLLAEQFAVRSEGRLVLSARGRAIARVFHGYRRLIARDLGG